MKSVIKPSEKETILLQVLADSVKELYGLEIIRQSGNILKAGSLYTSLSRMEAKGYIQSRREDEGESDSRNPRRVYKLTEFGQRVLSATYAFDDHMKKTLMVDM